MVQQALLEVRDLDSAAEFGEMAEIERLVVPLQHSLTELQEGLDDGTYEFSQDVLGFMPLVEAYDVDVLPFRYLLTSLNRTHTEGLDESGEDRAGIDVQVLRGKA